MDCRPTYKSYKLKDSRIAEDQKYLCDTGVGKDFLERYSGERM